MYTLRKAICKELACNSSSAKTVCYKKNVYQNQNKKKKNQMKGMTKGRHNNGETFVQNPEMSSSFL